MPLIEIHMLEGRSDQQKRALLDAVTESVRESIGAPLSTIRVWIQEFSPKEYMVAGQLFAAVTDVRDGLYLYEVLENQVIPLYYDRDIDGLRLYRDHRRQDTWYLILHREDRQDIAGIGECSPIGGLSIDDIDAIEDVIIVSKPSQLGKP